MLILFLGLTACQSHQPDPAGIVENKVVTQYPNQSDVFFEKALSAFDRNDPVKTSMYLREATSALKDEGRNMSPEERSDLFSAIAQIDGMTDEMEKGVPIERARLRNAITNAALQVAHRYLVKDDVYVLEEPEIRSRNILHRKLQNGKADLEKNMASLTDSERSEALKLHDEAVSLEKQLKDLDTGMERHIKKMEDFIKLHKPANKPLADKQ